MILVTSGEFIKSTRLMAFFTCQSSRIQFQLHLLEFWD